MALLQLIVLENLTQLKFSRSLYSPFIIILFYCSVYIYYHE